MGVLFLISMHVYILRPLKSLLQAEDSFGVRLTSYVVYNLAADIMIVLAGIHHTGNTRGDKVAYFIADYDTDHPRRLLIVLMLALVLILMVKLYTVDLFKQLIHDVMRSLRGKQLTANDTQTAKLKSVPIIRRNYVVVPNYYIDSYQ
jgi:hypothetical protein